MRLTERHRNAAQLLANGDRSQADVAAAVGVRRERVTRWLAVPEFRALVEAEAVAIRERIRAEGVASRQNRIDALNERWAAMRAVIAARADGHAGEAPGADTGLMVLTVRYLPGGGRVEEWAVDTGLLSELRATEKQAAEELGQWQEQRETPVHEATVRVYVDESGRSVVEARAAS